jgi:mannose-6-phosphate isomerase
MQTEANEYPGQHALYPLRFRAVYKDYIWGGEKIIRNYKRNAPPGIYAESWEVSTRPEGMSEVINGPLAGITLDDLCKQRGGELLGSKIKDSKFPLLIKLIDAKETLSVQVHPDDETAEQYGGEAKTEMWYVLDADKAGCVYCGLVPGTDARAFEANVGSRNFAKLLLKVPVSKGDAVFVPGGRIHAIGAGCLLLEVQQNSNTTYRIYDWDRVGPNGLPRELHIPQALQVTNWHDEQHPKVVQRKISEAGKNERWEVLTTKYFCLERLKLGEPMVAGGLSDTFHVLFVAKGGITLRAEGFRERGEAGTTWFVPSSVHQYFIEPQGGTAEVMRVSVP